MNKKTAIKVSQGRALHLIDIENLVGASNYSESQVAKVRKAYFDLVMPGEMDQFFVASSIHNQVATAFGWPNAQRKFLSGEDAADYLLAKRVIDVLQQGNFNHVYMASGDHSLADFVEYLQSFGVNVTVVSLERCISHDMRYSGAEVIYLQELYQLAA